MYTADNICRMIEFLIDNIFVQFGGRLSVRWLEFQWEQIVLHYLLTFSFTILGTNFSTIWSEVATGDLPGRLIYAIDT